MAGKRHISLSKSALLLSPCISWAGEQSRWYDEDKVDAEDRTKRDNGIAFHFAIQGHHNGVYCQASNQDVDVMLGHARKYLDQVMLPRCESVVTEAAVAVDWVTGDCEALPEIKDRNYPDMPGYQFGTADLVSVLKTGELYVADWKTGGTDGAEEQLLSLACVFQRLMLADPYAGALTLRQVIISCLQVNEEGVWPHERPVSQQELDNHWDSMRMQWEDLQSGKRTNPVPGIHCTALYCPHLAYCSAIGQMVAEQAGGAPASGLAPLLPVSALTRSHRVNAEPLDDHEAGEQMAVISACKRQIKYREQKMKDYIKNGGRVIAGQWEWSEGNNGYRWRK